MAGKGVRGWVMHWTNPSGLERFDAVVEYDAGGTRKRKRRTFKTRKEARAALAGLIVEGERLQREATQQQTRAHRRVGAVQAVGAPRTVGALLDMWLQRSIRGSRSARTMQLYTLTVRKHLVPYIGNIPLDEVEPGHIIALHDEWAAHATGGRTRVLAHTNLNQALTWALRMRWIEHNPVEGIPRPAHRAREMTAWTREEARRFLAVVAHSAYGPLWHLSLGTGLRRGELLGLRWDAINWERGVLRVEQALGYAGEGARVEIKAPKRHKKRAVNIPPVALALLREHRARQDAQRREAGSRWQEHGLVFTSATGTPIQPDNLLRAHYALIAQAGVPAIRFHDLRHTFATLALGGDDGIGEADLKVISESMGHADVSITLRVYAHILPARRKGLATRMDHVLFGEPMDDAADGVGGDAPEHGAGS